MLVIYHGETPLVSCGPRSIFYIWNTIYCNNLLSAFPTSNFHHPHYTINSLWSASRWDWQPHCYVGAKFLGCVVRGCWSKSYWFDNLGFFLRENLLLYSSYVPLGVSQRACDPRTSNRHHRLLLLRSPRPPSTLPSSLPNWAVVNRPKWTARPQFLLAADVNYAACPRTQGTVFLSL